MRVKLKKRGNENEPIILYQLVEKSAEEDKRDKHNKNSDKSTCNYIYRLTDLAKFPSLIYISKYNVELQYLIELVNHRSMSDRNF
jgi:hypothetical protein